MLQQVEFNIRTRSHQDLIPITEVVKTHLKNFNIQDGLLNLFVLHTTCGLTINENADPDVVHDLLQRLDRLAPWQDGNDRHREGNSAAHLKSSLLGSSLSIPIHNGRPVLGTWQGIYLGEFDGPRTRSIQMTVLSN